MDGIEWASSAMVAARTRLEIATGNLANVSTDGFHKILARGHLTASGIDIVRSESNEGGALRHTGQPFDFAIVGPGWFHVAAADGSVASTRDGSFARDRAGVLRDRLGRALMGANGAIHVPEDATIDQRGRIRAGNTIVGRIPMQRGAVLRTGFLECADVNAIGEMITVLAAQRSFESAQKVVTAIDVTRDKAANDVGRVK